MCPRRLEAYQKRKLSPEKTIRVPQNIREKVLLQVFYVDGIAWYS